MGIYSHLKPISEMKKYKSSDIAILLGSGPSINEITNDRKKIIEQHDTWTLNNWIYHPSIIPDFYHLELKYFNFFIFQRRMNEKRELYKNVKFFIADKDRKITLHFPDGSIKKRAGSLIDAIGGQHPYLFYFKQRFIGKSNDKIIDAKYKMSKKFVTKKHVASITVMLEMLYKFGYKKVYLYGVDLNTSSYFWTEGNKSVYGEVHHQYNKQHEGNAKDRFHATYRIKDFIIDFNNRFMIPENKEIYTATKNTLLYPGLRYKDIVGEKT
jgi:hypothetical protein